MRKLLNQPWFVALLAVAAVGFVAESLRQQRAPIGRMLAAAGPTPDAPLPGGSTAAAATPAVDLADLPAPKFQRDPFARLMPAAAAPVAAETADKARPDIVETVHLSALWSQDGTTLVLLNGEIHQAGDTIGRLKVDTATQDGVWLSHRTGRDFLKLGEDFTLRTPDNEPPVAAHEP